MKLRKSCSGRKENEFFITAGAALATKKATVSVFGLIFLQGRNYAQWMIPNETPLWIVGGTVRKM